MTHPVHHAAIIARVRDLQTRPAAPRHTPYELVARVLDVLPADLRALLGAPSASADASVLSLIVRCSDIVQEEDGPAVLRPLPGLHAAFDRLLSVAAGGLAADLTAVAQDRARQDALRLVRALGRGARAAWWPGSAPELSAATLGGPATSLVAWCRPVAQGDLPPLAEIATRVEVHHHTDGTHPTWTPVASDVGAAVLDIIDRRLLLHGFAVDARPEPGGGGVVWHGGQRRLSADAGGLRVAARTHDGWGSGRVLSVTPDEAGVITELLEVLDWVAGLALDQVDREFLVVRLAETIQAVAGRVDSVAETLTALREGLYLGFAARPAAGRRSVADAIGTWCADRLQPVIPRPGTRVAWTPPGSAAPVDAFVRGRASRRSIATLPLPWRVRRRLRRDLQQCTDPNPVLLREGTTVHVVGLAALTSWVAPAPGLFWLTRGR